MSRLILVIGKAGRGKSTAIRRMDPQTTFIINVLGKELPFAKATQYLEGENLLTTASGPTILREMQRVSQQQRFKDLVIDDLQYVMATEFMEKAFVKGYDKFTQMAKNIWDILRSASTLRSDLHVWALTHEDDSGTERKMKTLGRLLDEKLTPEGMATIVLFADVRVHDNGQRTYFFQTQSDGVTNAKSPIGLFPPYVPNDLQLLTQRIREYYEEGVEEWEKSKYASELALQL